MIIASVADAARYEKLNPLFTQAFDFVRAADPAVLEPGPHVLVEDALVVMVNETAMKAPEKARMEVHNKFIDIHVPLSRDERFTWKEATGNVEEIVTIDDAGHGQFLVHGGNVAVWIPENAPQDPKQDARKDDAEEES